MSNVSEPRSAVTAYFDELASLARAENLRQSQCVPNPSEEALSLATLLLHVDACRCADCLGTLILLFNKYQPGFLLTCLYLKAYVEAFPVESLACFDQTEDPRDIFWDLLSSPAKSLSQRTFFAGVKKMQDLMLGLQQWMDRFKSGPEPIILEFNHDVCDTFTNLDD